MTRGFSTIEIVLALMILSSTLAGILLVTLGIPGTIADGRLRASAIQLADEKIQKELQTGLHAFSSVTSEATTSANGYASSFTVTSLPDEFTEMITSTVEWIDTKGRSQVINRSSVLTDYLSAARAGCTGLLAGDWTRPSVTQYFMSTPFIPVQAKNRYPISAIATSPTVLAVGISPTNVRNEPDIYLFDITNPKNPVYQGSIDTNLLQFIGPTSLAIHGTTLFAGNGYGASFGSCPNADTQCSQIQAYDISNPRNPIKLYPYELPANSPPYATGVNGQASGKTLFVENNLLYLGLQKTGNSNGEEFNILDVSHSSPVWLGGYAIGRTINQIIVSHGYAYLATDSPQNELIVLDVHDPTHVTFVGDYDASGGSTFGYGESIGLAGNELALGRSYTYQSPELYFMDISKLPPTIQSSQMPGIQTRPSNIDAIIISKFLAFVLDDTQLSILNITDPVNPTPYAAPIALPGVTTGEQGPAGVALACQGKALYMASIDTINSGRLNVITGS